MAEKNFESLGRVEAIAALYEGTPYTPFDSGAFETAGKAYCTLKSKTLLEGIDFDLTYFPLKHLGYKSVICVTGELYASFSAPRALDVVLGISAKLDFEQIQELWEGVVTAAKEHGYSRVGLDLVPSRNGLSISVGASGETSLLDAKRRPEPKSMDLICVSGNLGAAFLGLNVLEREKMKFAQAGDELEQPDLEKYKQLVGAYLKPELPAGVLDALADSEIYPSMGCFVTRGLGDALRRLSRDSGLGAKIYVDRLPFAGGSVDTAKEFDLDPVSAAMNGGDDCRLLFTIPIGKHDKFRHDFQVFDIIGHLAKSDVGTVLVLPDGAEIPVRAQGWKESF